MPRCQSRTGWLVTTVSGGTLPYATWPLIARRHGRNEKGELRLAADHVGLGGKWECLPERLWLLGELSWQADDEDPYALTRRGGV